MEGGEKRSGSPVAPDHFSYKKRRRRSEVVEESIVETEEQIAEIDKESIVKPDEEEDAPVVRSMNERLILQRGLRWVIYRFMVLEEDDKEKFVSSVESLQQDFDKDKSLIDLFQGPPKFVMVAVEANTLEAMAKFGVGIREIVDRFYGVSGISQNSNQVMVTARLLFFESEVLYLLNRKKIQRLAATQHCTINLYNSGYSSSDMLLGQKDIIVEVEGKCENVCTVLVDMFLCVYEEFRHVKELVHSMETRMRNLPSRGLPHEVYVYGRKQKMVASYKDEKEIMSPNYLSLGKPYLSVRFELDFANIFTREEGKLINHIRGPMEAEFEVQLTECGRGFVMLVIVGKSAGLVTEVMDSLVKTLQYMGNVREQRLAHVLKERQCNGNEAGGYFVGCWLTDDESEDEDEDKDA